jgi:hypothetical protein
MKKILTEYGGSLEGRKMIKSVLSKGSWDEWQQKRIDLIF